MFVSYKNKKQNVSSNSYHLPRPISYREIEKLFVRKKKLTMSKSTYLRLSKKVKLFLEERKVNIKITSRQGRPINISTKDMIKIIELNKAGFNIRSIANKLNMPKSTVHHLIKYSKRNKIKHAGSTIFMD